jgi:hypothetical protein
MLKNRIISLAMTSAFVLSFHPAHAQNAPASGMYQIVSGTYIACCGFAGEIRSSLPNDNQGFVRLSVDAQSHIGSMAFLGKDMRTVFSVIACPPDDPIKFSFDYGFVVSDSLVFHVDPGPPPYHKYWNYTVSNSVDTLRINGVLGVNSQFCADVPTRFSHSNVVAVLLIPPKIRITEFSKEGALLFIQGQAGRTNVLEASTDLATWTAISTNLMPFTLCPECPYILFRDSLNLNRRFYRCSETP